MSTKNIVTTMATIESAGAKFSLFNVEINGQWETAILLDCDREALGVVQSTLESWVKAQTFSGQRTNFQIDVIRKEFDGRLKVVGLEGRRIDLYATASKSESTKRSKPKSPPPMLEQFYCSTEIDRKKNGTVVERLVKVTNKFGETVQYLVANPQGMVLRGLGRVSLMEARLAFGKPYNPPQTQGSGVGSSAQATGLKKQFSSTMVGEDITRCRTQLRATPFSFGLSVCYTQGHEIKTRL